MLNEIAPGEACEFHCIEAEDVFGSRLVQSQKATAAARCTAERTFRASLS
jgi:hypothetical protein